MKNLKRADPNLHKHIVREFNRQKFVLNLIPSENYVSKAVLEASGTILMNKYAEGYPKKRYYAGCKYYDVVENLARDRIKALFGAEHANGVLPHGEPIH